MCNQTVMLSLTVLRLKFYPNWGYPIHLSQTNQVPIQDIWASIPCMSLNSDNIVQPVHDHMTQSLSIHNESFNEQVKIWYIDLGA
jgi:hypothetical protein